MVRMREARMRALTGGIILACWGLVLGGCNKPQASHADSKVEKKVEVVKPADPQPQPKPPAVRPAPELRIADAQHRMAADLRALRAHPWKAKPSPAVLAAAARVFAGRNPDSSPMTGGAVDFVGMTQTQVKSLIGNPCEKRPDGAGVVWVYAYKGGTIGTVAFDAAGVATHCGPA